MKKLLLWLLVAAFLLAACGGSAPPEQQQSAPIPTVDPLLETTPTVLDVGKSTQLDEMKITFISVDSTGCNINLGTQAAHYAFDEGKYVQKNLFVRCRVLFRKVVQVYHQ